jgi:hypothetical protein
MKHDLPVILSLAGIFFLAMAADSRELTLPRAAVIMSLAAITFGVVMFALMRKGRP